MNTPIPGTGPRGRYAPSPTGLTHLGNARTALIAWLSVRNRGGSFVWRLEDLDTPRTIAGTAEAAAEDLSWLGLDWDEGGGLPGDCGPYEQSARGNIYDTALARLAGRGVTFPCKRSRRDLAAAASAPQTSHGSSPYPAAFRPKDLAGDWYPRLRSMEQPDAAVRFRVEPGVVRFNDAVYGEISESVAEAVGDFVLKRRDGLYAYQLAVVVDDLQMGINEVVRGRDLLESTARQIVLIRALGGKVPAYAHVPLLLATDGEKLSKRNHALTLRSLRTSGVAPEQVVGWLAASCGLLPTAKACSAGELIESFNWNRMARNDQTTPDDVTDRIRALR
ncbi:MAG: glutamyl-tRNA synthetase [Hyphomicrobiaceae bacterium]|jgi:glutamyl-tRNA synthetase